MMELLNFLIMASVNCALLLQMRGVSAEGREHKVALVIIDVQDCFLPPGGSVAVPNGTDVIPVINRIRRDRDLSLVVLSQDWHCEDHVSFASQHPGVSPGTVLSLTYNQQGQLCYGDNVPRDNAYAVNCTGQQVREVSQYMWPDHCIKNVTSGPTSAAFSTSLNWTSSDVVIRKGGKCGIDSYSAFYDNGGFSQTQLNSVLKSRGIDTVVVTGLALDFCVYYTSKDAHALGYTVLTVTDASRGVRPVSTDKALKDMANTGIHLVTEAELGAALDKLTNSAVQPRAPLLGYLLLTVTLVSTAFPHH